MTTTATVANQSVLSIGTGSGSALTISAIQLGNPTIITSTAHGRANGDVLALAGLTGANASVLNGNSYAIKNKTANTFAVDADTTGLTITASGTATPTLWTQVNNLKSYAGLDGARPDITVTNLSSTATEYVVGLPDTGKFQVPVDLDDTDTGQIAMRTAYQSVPAPLKSFKIALPNGKTLTFSGFVTKWPISGSVNNTIQAAGEIRATGVYTMS